jgi:lysozyme
MDYSNQGLRLTESFEGLRLEAYKDVAGTWTIGYGHIAGVCEGMTCTQEQAEAWLQEDTAWAASVVNRYVTVPVTQGQFDALVDFTFNLGSGHFKNSHLLQLVNAGDLTGAADEFEKWAYAGGHVVAGLLRRRQAEKDLFTGDNS